MVFSVEPSYKRYLWNRFFAWGGNALASVFITIYLWRLQHSFALILLYYLLSSLASIISFAGLGAPITKERSALVSLRLGIVGFVVFYGLFFALRERVVALFWLLAIIEGIIKGLYWIADYTLRHDMSSAQGRRSNVAAENLLITSINFVAPLLSSFIITRTSLSAVEAYAPIFILSLVMYAGAFINSFFFKAYRPQRKHYALWSKTKIVLLNPRGRQITRATLYGGFADSVIGLGIPLLLYALSSSELSIGWFEAFKVGISAVVLYMTAKLITPDKYKHYLLAFGTVLFLAHLLPAFSPTVYTIFFFGAILSMVSPLVDTLWVALYYNTPLVICKTRDATDGMKTEYFVLEETAASIGRILSLIALFLAYLYANKLILALQMLIGLAGFARFLQYYQSARMKLENGV